jgi:uncharacterized phosphatase
MIGVESMTRVCFVRHGETDWNLHGRIQGREDIALNKTGIEQANLSGEHLKNEHWDVLVSSPLQRAKKTAEIIKEYIDIDNIVDMDEFVERGYGEASGMTKKEREEAFPDGNIPGVETQAGLSERVMRGLDILAGKYPGKKVLVVAHGGVINAILTAVSNGEVGSGKTRLGNACINLLDHSENRWNIRAHNLTSHLMSK